VVPQQEKEYQLLATVSYLKVVLSASYMHF